MTNHEVLVLISSDPPHRFQGIARLAGECGWHIRTESRRMPPSDWNGDGVLVMLEDFPALKKFISKMQKRNVPVVDLLENQPDMPIVRVTGDNPAIGNLAAEHFNERDFRHAAFFSVRHNHTHDLRIDGFREKWKGSTFEQWLWPDEGGDDVGNWRKMSEWLVKKLMDAPKPIAVFAWNDYDATHVLDACRRAELDVPNDVAILGVDDNRVICIHQSVPLSSIAHDHERVGYAAAATLERMMSGREPRHRLIRVRPHGVVTRESTDTFAVNEQELKPAIRYITDNLHRPFGAAQIAAALGMPRIRLDRMFARKLGHSAGTEIARRRLSLARKLLKETDYSLSKIAELCGFCHASFMIRTFRAATGMTPTAWRKKPLSADANFSRE